LGGNKRAGLSFFFRHLEPYVRESAFLLQLRLGIIIQEFAGTDSQPVLQAKNIVGSKNESEAGTALVETRDLGIAGKVEPVVQGLENIARRL